MTQFLIIGQTATDEMQSLVEVINNCVPEAEIDQVDTAQQNIGAIAPSDYDLILVDYELGIDKNGLQLLQFLKKQTDCPPLILLIDTSVDSNVAINAIRAGASNYIIKSDISVKNVLLKITESMEKNEQAPETHVFNARDDNDPDFFDLTSESDESSSGEDGKLLIPGYEILKELARGGMSTVLLARSEEDDSEVVLKVMFLTGDEDQQSLKRFIQEYNLISHLVHPHVIRIYERAFASDFAYIAMEYLQNGDLTTRIRRKVAPHEALEYLHQIAMGLEAAHKLNIVHRDLKPGNILFNDDDTLVITDFGAAKVLTDEATDITIGDAIVGTPYYISPEQGTGTSIDNRSDLYSLGVIFHEMLTGYRPYKASTIAQLIQAHVNSPIPVLEGEFAIYQPLMDGMLAKDPDERFQSAGELIMGIEWITKKLD